jgi:hypothetical protein
MHFSSPLFFGFLCLEGGEEIYAKSWPTLQNNLQQQAFLVKPAILWPSLIPSTAFLAQSKAPTLSMTKTTLDRHGHGHFSKLTHFSKPLRQWTPMCTIEPSQASHHHFNVPLGLSRPCPSRRFFIEHLAGVQSMASPRAYRAPTHCISRHWALIESLNAMAQPRLSPLLFTSCPMCHPVEPVNAQQGDSLPRRHAPTSSFFRTLPSLACAHTPHLPLKSTHALSSSSPLLPRPSFVSSLAGRENEPERI